MRRFGAVRTLGSGMDFKAGMRLTGALALTLLIGGCAGSTQGARSGAGAGNGPRSAAAARAAAAADALPGMPPLLAPHDVYAADRPGELSPAVRGDRPLVYVPNSGSDTVDEIDPHTYRIVRSFSVGALPQHVVPSWDLRTLWVTNDIGNSLTAIDPRTGRPGRTVHVEDPYNLYFTPDGRSAVVMAERLREVVFRDAETMALHHVVNVPSCAGVNHADFTADGRLMLASCEFGSSMIVIDLETERVVRRIPLPAGSSPQDVKLAPGGRIFYVADLVHGGLWLISARTLHRVGFLPTGAGAHGLYPSRDSRFLYVSNRSDGSVSVVSFRRRRVVRTWRLPGGGSPDMGNVSASGRVLWLSGRYNSVVYAIDTRTGRLLHEIPVGFGPHGLCVFPIPGRYSLGHTGITR